MNETTAYLIVGVLAVLLVCTIAARLMSWLADELRNAPIMPSDDNENFYKAVGKAGDERHS